MDVGTGIFLSGVLIAIVALYIATRDRWNWMKIVLWPSGVLLVLGTSFYLYSLIPAKPKIEKSFWEITLGASESDVLFAKGAPTTKNTHHWLYRFNDDNGNWKYVYHVNFEDGKVWAIAYFAASSLDWHEQIQGINVGDSENSVRDKFGIPSPLVSSDDGLRRIYHYRDYNVVFELAQNKITGLGIYSPDIAPKGLKFNTGEETARK